MSGSMLDGQIAVGMEDDEGDLDSVDSATIDVEDSLEDK